MPSPNRGPALKRLQVTNLCQMLGHIHECTRGQRPPCPGCVTRAEMLHTQVSPKTPEPAPAS